MKNLLLISVCIMAGLLYTATSRAQITRYTAGEVMRILSDDSFEGRDPGSTGLEKAVTWVESYLKNAGIAPYFGHGYRDSFRTGDILTCNIVGIIPAAEQTDRFVILSAHLDHLGMVTAEPGTDHIFNGANDNASGVAAVLSIASGLKNTGLQHNLLVVLFSAEESGLLGSYHMARWMKQKDINVAYVINLEMLGAPYAPAPGKVYMTGWDHSDMGACINRLYGSELAVRFEMGELYRLFEHSDNYPFYQIMKVPAHTLSTFDLSSYEYYHHADDEASAIDIRHLEEITRELGVALERLLTSSMEILSRD